MFSGHWRESSVRFLTVNVLFLVFVGFPFLVGAQTPTPAPIVTWKDQVVGTGFPVTSGRVVSVHYTGKFQNGKVFDESHRKGAPFVFVQGVTHLIPGWTQGIAGMRPGGRRLITIPPALAYTDEGGLGAIPPNSTLIYEVEVVKVE